MMFHSPLAIAMDTQSGFLVFQISHVPYSQDSKSVEHSFKVKLTKEFLAQFKHLPGPSRSGTGVFCGGGLDESSPYSWWVRRNSEGGLSVNMWRNGPLNPKASQYVNFRTWKDIDMAYQLSFDGKIMGEGANETFSVKWYPTSVRALENIPLAPIRKADESILEKGNAAQGKIRFKCAFQEG
jgi:hypothetical protein